MSSGKPRVLRRADLKFVALCGASLLLIAFYLRGALEPGGDAGLYAPASAAGTLRPRPEAGRPRKTDIRKVQRLVIRGELSSREASYYRPEEEAR